ncbi:Nucleolar complex protein [Trichinella spiralis]|uniref:Nucleolar complex protein n=1 Tax=Trichinella spiralis TaxID=6334 RepID=A0ABR3L0G1_TRISP
MNGHATNRFLVFRESEHWAVLGIKVQIVSMYGVALIDLYCVSSNKEAISGERCDSGAGHARERSTAQTRQGPQGRCQKCNVRLHAERGKQCFEIYHRQK